MKKTTFLFMLLFLIPSFVFAVSNAKINGQKSITISELPTQVVFTCDVAANGNRLAVEVYVDIDNNGTIGAQEPLVFFFFITDGVGWIRDPQDPDCDLIGDETGVDGKIQTTIDFGFEDMPVPEGMSGILKFTDQDNSTDQVTFHVAATFPPPYIQGKVTEKGTGTPLANITVLAENEEEGMRAGVTDASGDYKINVSEGTWEVVAMEFPIAHHQPSDTATVTVTGTTSQTKDFELEPYNCFVTGKLTLENGTPVPGILVLAGGDALFDFGGFGETDEQGVYTIGVKPGEVIVTVSYLFNAALDGESNWPTDTYAVPESDTLTVADGQTVTSDFVFKSYTAFVTGTCTVNDAPLADVEITGLSMDMSTFSFMYYQAYSGTDGTYRMGVKPGVITALMADKDGYDLSDPMFGYQQITVADGQTVSGKDFKFDPLSGVTSISGTVTYGDGSAASNIYVAAVNDEETSPTGYLISYTDASGNYSFENIMDGWWQVGVYSNNHQSEPPMRYIDLFMGTQQSGQDFVLTEGTAVSDANLNFNPYTFSLSQNFPNPFNPTTTIKFSLPNSGEVLINIFNAQGQLINTLADGQFNAGSHILKWDGRNYSGQKVSSGIYFYQIKTKGFNKVMKMILTK